MTQSNDNKPKRPGVFKGTATALSIVFGLAALPVTTVQATAHHVPREASIVMDYKTGFIVSSRYAQAERHPASLTKIMTLLLVFEAVKDGRLSWDQDIAVSRAAAAQPPVKLGLRAGSTIKLRDAAAIVAVRSSNDMAVALAEAVAGTEADFAQAMTQRARDMGLDVTTFVNASGLPAGGQITTAEEMAELARYVIRNHPNEYEDFFSQSRVRVNGRTFTTTNRLMLSYPGMDGMKTGYINMSGFNLVASAERGDRRLIGVVFGGSSASARNHTMRRLLDAGFKAIVPPLPTPRPAYTPPVIPLPTPRPDPDADEATLPPQARFMDKKGPQPL